MKDKLIRCLYKILAVTDQPLGRNFRKSGNIQNKLKEFETDEVIELADAHYKRTAKEKESSEEGYLLGRLNRTKKTVFRIELPPYLFFFIGSEADILRKIAKFKEEKEKKEQEKGTKKEGTDKEKKENKEEKKEGTDKEKKDTGEKEKKVRELLETNITGRKHAK